MSAYIRSTAPAVRASAMSFPIPLTPMRISALTAMISAVAEAMRNPVATCGSALGSTTQRARSQRLKRNARAVLRSLVDVAGDVHGLDDQRPDAPKDDHEHSAAQAQSPQQDRERDQDVARHRSEELDQRAGRTPHQLERAERDRRQVTSMHDASARN